jgi:hypothetical protein
MLEKLLGVFPQRVVEGQVAPHDCPECRALRSQLSGSAWATVPREFIRENPDTLVLLSHEAYLAYLPAWLRQAVLEPGGEVAAGLLVNIHCGPDLTGFTAEQGAAIIEVARFIVQNNGWEPDDPVNVESAVAIERTWSRATSHPWLPVPPDPPPPR